MTRLTSLLDPFHIIPKIREGLTHMTTTDLTETAETEIVPTSDTEAAAPKDRAASLLATRKQKMDELFSGKRFEIVQEIHLEGDQRFETPFGNKGRHGFHLRPEGTTDKGFIVGATMLEQIASEYGAGTLPAKERKRRTKEQKAADDAAAAAAKADSAS
jgi:hypothetical protein